MVRKIRMLTGVLFLTVLSFYFCNKGLAAADESSAHKKQKYNCAKNKQAAAIGKGSTPGKEDGCFRDKFDRLLSACLLNAEANSSQPVSETIQTGENEAGESSEKSGTLSAEASREEEKNFETEKGMPKQCVMARKERNRIIDDLIREINVNYAKQSARLLSNGAGAGAAWNAVKASFNVEETDDAYATADTKISALTGFLFSDKDSPDANFIPGNSAEAIALKMDALRTLKYAQIIQKKSWNVVFYNLNAAIKDIYEYYQAGTVTGASIAISDEAAKEKQETADKFKEIPDFMKESPAKVK